MPVEVFMSEKKWFFLFLFFLFVVVSLFFLKSVNAGDEVYSPKDVKILEHRDEEDGQINDDLMPAGDVKRYRDSGVIIKVKRMPDEKEGHKTFEVTAENQNAVKRTLSGRICLFDLRIKQAECGSGSCPVYMELPPKSKEIKKWNCQEKSFFSAWTFVIIRIY
jgi:hypothetical protein